MADGFRRLVEVLSGNLESSDRYCRAPKKVYMSYGRLNARVCEDAYTARRIFSGAWLSVMNKYFSSGE